MYCKNCKHTLEESAQFCDKCGGKVIKSRISLKFLLIELFAVMGIESLFFRTLKTMFTQPDKVINEYLTGVRKKYLNPFAYLAVGAALALVTFNFFSKEFMDIQSKNVPQQAIEMRELAEKDLSTIKGLTEEEYKALEKQQQAAKINIKFQEAFLKFFIKYFNLMAFLFLPFYALVSKWTYRKPYNFGEHIVMNAYMQGSTMYISVLAFLISLYTHPLVYTFSIILFMFYYSFTFSKLYKHDLGQAIVKFLKFLLVLSVVIIILTVLLGVLSFIIMLVMAKTNPELLKGLTPN